MQKEIYQNLYSNRLMKTNKQIEVFEKNLEILASTFSEKDVLELCSIFDDETEHEEVMFGAIHLLETLSSEEALELIIAGVTKMDDTAPEWADIIVSRYLNADFRVQRMMERSPIKIPEEYFKIVFGKSDLEIDIDNKIFRIWDVSGCLELNEAYHIQKYLPKSWAIGDDEEGYAIIYSEEENGVGLYAVSFSDLDDNEKIFLVPSLSDFLVKGIGINTFLEI